MAAVFLPFILLINDVQTFQKQILFYNDFPLTKRRDVLSHPTGGE
jgi:hypothetical protein